MSPDDLHPDDAELWQQLKQSVKPIRKRYHSDAPVRKMKQSTQAAFKPMLDFSAMNQSQPMQQTPLQQGANAGIDRRTATRFTRGKMTIEATLDLHGMPAHLAHQKVANFIHTHYARGSRCVLIVTGKGARDPETGQKGGGVLREALPQWLQLEDVRPFVLAYEQAQQQHGGSGAYYILIRRKRS